MNPTYSVSQSTAICAGDSLFAQGAWQFTAGTYFDTLITVDGCDSIITTNLTISPVYAVADSASICAGDSVFAGGIWQDSSGVFVDSLLSVDGCDSVVTTVLTVFPTWLTNLSDTICAGDSIQLAGSWQTTAGSYTDSLLTAHGCDSLIVTQLTVLPTFLTQLFDTICGNDSLFAGGGWQHTSGTYFDTLAAMNGCDSVLQLNLTISLVIADTVSAAICPGDSLLVGGAWQHAAGNYADTLIAA